MVTPQNIGRVVAAVRRAVRAFRPAAMEAHRRDPFRTLVGCILSLRTRDETTADACRRLFREAPTPERLARLPRKRIERAIYPVGFYRTKARVVQEVARTLLERHGGRVPQRLDELLRLKGVGRKTANLVLTLAFGKDGICVDTHVHRISNRWGLVRTRTPEQTERELRRCLPKRYWKSFNGLLVPFGQNLCRPLSPWCSRCPVARLCPRVGVTRSR